MADQFEVAEVIFNRHAWVSRYKNIRDESGADVERMA